MADYEFVLPLVVYIPLKTKPDIRFGVDVNTFKSMNRFNYNKAKVIYCEHMRAVRRLFMHYFANKDSLPILCS